MWINAAVAEETKTIITQETITEEPQTSSSIASIGSNWTSMVPMVLIFLVFYFLLIRPQEKRRKQQEALVGSVKKGEKVLTTSGIFGSVTKVNESDNTLEIEVAENVDVKILKSSVADIISRQKIQKSSKDEVKLVASKEEPKSKKGNG
jgi:preprotein translocase subunit YajC